jgi:hypothetical protein
MFSEPYEAELLLLKLEMESDIVDEWIVIESAYTFQGEYKGHYLKNIVTADSRFQRYRSKITICEENENHNRFYLMPPLGYLNRYVKLRIPKFRSQLVALSEEAGFFAEKNQREVVIDRLVRNYEDEDYLILTDVDEMLDGTDGGKREAILGVLKSSEPSFKVRRKIFMYDFDNVTFRKRYSPVLNIAAIKKMKSQIRHWVAQHIRTRLIWGGMKEIKFDKDLFYEFSYCFDKSKIIRKEKTYAHTGRGEVAIERALLCNHSFRDINMINQEFIASKEDWFEKIDVSTNNLPSIVVDRFESFRTNSVAANYKEMREKYYGLVPQ